MNTFFSAGSLYTMHELQKASFTPLRMMAEAGEHLHLNPLSPFAYNAFSRSMGAAWALVGRATRDYHKPVFGLAHTKVGNKTVEVTEHVVHSKDFCNLLHFEKQTKERGPKMLVVAPMSGHHATLLRGTVEGLLPFCDVYITDWIDAREVPLSQGGFDLDDYIDYVIEFLRLLGPDVHVMGVCQPSVPVLAAVSIMNSQKDKKAPLSMTFMGGPIDTRVNPTQVNLYSQRHSVEWFERHVVTRVPFKYPAFMRKVYPGFLQLTGFMSMNIGRHVGEHVKLFQHLIKGDGENAESHKKFYDEYLSVMDLPAEFYLQTLKTVFIDHALPKGEMVSRKRPVRPDEVTHTALLTIEGELDDISGVGQTEAAQKLCSNLPKDKKKHHLQKGVGHYGIFNGRKYREQVVPIIVNFIEAQEKKGSKSAA